MPDPSTAIIILAAGESSRMGQPKQMIDIGGTPLIQRIAQKALEAACGPVIIVLGANAELISPTLKELNVQTVINENWATGMAGSIRVGLDKVIGNFPAVQGVILMVADQPDITADCLEQLIEAQNQGNATLAAAGYNGDMGTPAYFAKKYFEPLRKLSGHSGAKNLLKQHEADLVIVDMPEAAIDLDTPDDVARFTEKSSGALMASQTRRQFISTVAVAGVGMASLPNFFQSRSNAEPTPAAKPAIEIAKVPVKLRINGSEENLNLDPRVTLLDALREHLGLTGTKKGCDHGQCGACTVLVNGKRINSCLALAVVHDGDEVTTIEGLAKDGKLHPVQTAFLEHDGFQCGYCTPGQICSAVALMKEGHCGSDPEIREWMSGNICRCGAYPNIVAAIREAQSKMEGAV